MNGRLQLLSNDELRQRLAPIQQLMAQAGCNAMLISDNTNIYYITGRIFSGYVYITPDSDPIYFVKRPVELTGDGVVYIRKPEDIPAHLPSLPKAIALELDLATYSNIQRLSKVFESAQIVNASPILRQVRSVKTPLEVELIRESGVKHVMVTRRIPGLFRQGMTDVELQVEIERLSRLEGCLGQFRIAGDSMELFMGNVIAGDNADAPSPYDFAMGGAGIDPSVPVGANGTELRMGMSVMVDMNGNFNGHMTDMTRTFSVGRLSDDLAYRAHDLSIAIHRELQTIARPGVQAKDLYNRAMEMVDNEGLQKYFMGHRQQAGFIGHGIGIEVNEAPVLAPRSRDILALRNVIAIEPKFVIPGVGAVGIENTYVVTPDGLESLTVCPEEIISLI